MLPIGTKHGMVWTRLRASHSVFVVRWIFTGTDRTEPSSQKKKKKFRKIPSLAKRPGSIKSRVLGRKAMFGRGKAFFFKKKFFWRQPTGHGLDGALSIEHGGPKGVFARDENHWGHYRTRPGRMRGPGMTHLRKKKK